MTESQFKAFFDSYLIQELEAIEGLRKDAKRFQLYAWLSLAIGIFLLILLKNPLLSILPMGLLFAYTMWQGTKDASKYKRHFREHIVPKLVQAFQPNARYFAHQGLPKADFIEARITQKPDSYYSRDLVVANIGGTQLEFSEVLAKKRTTDSKGKSKSTILLQGVFAKVDFPKRFHGTTYVNSDFAERHLGLFGKFFQKMRFGPLKLVELEDPEFEKEFVVFSDDQIEARYLLSTSFMKRLTEYKRGIDKKIVLRFVNNQLFIAIYLGRGIFEVGIFKNYLDYKTMLVLFRDCQMCFGLVKDLNLDTRIWNDG